MVAVYRQDVPGVETPFSLRHALKMMLHMRDIVFQHEPQCDAIFSKEPDAGNVRLVNTLNGLREMKIEHPPK